MYRLLQFLGARVVRKPRRSGDKQRSTRQRLALCEPLERRELLTIAVTPTYTVTENWTSGFQAQVKLDNRDAAGLAAWQLEFDYGANITSIWDATIASHVGTNYVIRGAQWNNTIAGGGAVQFGFVAAPGTTPTAPTNYKINGNTIGDTTPPPPAIGISISDRSLNEGQTSTTSALLTVSLSAAATTPISVSYATTNGTAISDSDYQATSGKITFLAGQTSQIIMVSLLGDSTFEADENLFVDLTGPVGATLAKARGTITVENDDAAPPASGDFQFQVSDNWGSGFTADITARNTTSAAIDDWRLEFDFAGNITSIWNATLVSRVGDHYTIRNAGYNSLVAAGAAVTFGFTGSPGGTIAAPTNYRLSGGAGGGNPGGTTNQAPIAADDAAYTTPGQAVTINLLANDRDPDGDALSILSVGAAAHGVVTLNADGSARYTPQAGYTGGDAFTYQLRDARGATATSRATINIAVPSVWPAHVFAPYVDMTLYPIFDLVTAAREQGLRYFSLAFIVADSQNRPAWGGYSEYALGTEYDAQMKAQIGGVRALGGDVVVSFGGAANRELAEVITDVSALKQAYQSVIDAYGLTHIDFDIEGGASAHRASVDRRNQAIALLQADAAAAGRVLDVSYTLPVLPSGLTGDGLYIVQSAVRFGVHLSVVNVMAMDYGDSAAPNPQGKMGDYAIAAGTSLFAQLKSVYGAAKTDAQLWNMVGLTPMIGLNDVTTEVFDQQEAREVLAFAQQKGIGRIAFWSLNRDRQNPTGQIGYVENTSSSIPQQLYEFSQIFKAFTG